MVTKQQIKSIIKEKATGAVNGPSGGDCKFKGVRKRKWGKYVSEIRLPNSRERIWLGSYDTAEKAARAFDAAMFCLRGRSANFNFPDNPPEIAGGQSLSRSEIQEAAANFANCHTQQHQQQQPMSISKDSSEVNCYMSETLTQSPSISAISDGTVQLDFELDLDQQSDLMSDGGSFLDVLTTMGSGNYATDYGYFPEFGDFYSPELPSDVDYGVEHVDGVLPQESFLWNF